MAGLKVMTCERGRRRRRGQRRSSRSRWPGVRTDGARSGTFGRRSRSAQGN